MNQQQLHQQLEQKKQQQQSLLVNQECGVSDLEDNSQTSFHLAASPKVGTSQETTAPLIYINSPKTTNVPTSDQVYVTTTLNNGDLSSAYESSDQETYVYKIDSSKDLLNVGDRINSMRSPMSAPSLELSPSKTDVSDMDRSQSREAHSSFIKTNTVSFDIPVVPHYDADHSSEDEKKTCLSYFLYFVFRYSF